MISNLQDKILNPDIHVHVVRVQHYGYSAPLFRF